MCVLYFERLFHFLLCLLLFPAQDCDKFTKLNPAHAFIGTSVKLRLLLYTRENGTCGTLLSHTDLSASPRLNLSKPSTFIIHGFRPTGSKPVWLNDMTQALLAREDTNAIVVDWNRGAATSYFKAAENTKKAADNMTAFVKLMQVWEASVKPMTASPDKHSYWLFSGARCISEFCPHDWIQSRSSFVRFCRRKPQRVNRKNYR